jgi:alpha-L-rhamnosidase
VKIAPALGSLKRAQGRVPHPLGDIDVRLERGDEKAVVAEVTLPKGLTGVFEWAGRRLPLHEGYQKLRP